MSLVRYSWWIRPSFPYIIDDASGHYLPNVFNENTQFIFLLKINWVVPQFCFIEDLVVLFVALEPFADILRPWLSVCSQKVRFPLCIYCAGRLQTILAWYYSNFLASKDSGRYFFYIYIYINRKTVYKCDNNLTCYSQQ